MKLPHLSWIAPLLCLSTLAAQAQQASTNSAGAAEDPDAGALMLADQTNKPIEKPRDWRAFAEAAYGNSALRPLGLNQDNQRLSLDLQYDHSFDKTWRFVFADRLDATWPAGAYNQRSINTIKELYLNWKPAEFSLLDAGRINVRNGVAYGYNPTDFFKTGATRSVVSIDPASMKENRQGSTMLRGQQLWESGSASLVYSPKLSEQTSTSGWNPNLAATNHEDRWLLSVSQKIGDFSPQFLLYKSQQLPPQFGLNMTGLLNDSMVGFFEWSGGRSPSQFAQALAPWLPSATDKRWYNRLSTGLTYTTTNKLTITGEYHYNGAAIAQPQWDQLRTTALLPYAAYRSWVQTAQDLPTRQELFVYATWQDVIWPRFDLSAMSNYDLTDHSKRFWLEGRYHADHWEYALQWQRNTGSALSNFGAAPVQYGWQASLRYYF